VGSKQRARWQRVRTSLAACVSSESLRKGSLRGSTEPRECTQRVDIQNEQKYFASVLSKTIQHHHHLPPTTALHGVLAMAPNLVHVVVAALSVAGRPAAHAVAHRHRPHQPAHSPRQQARTPAPVVGCHRTRLVGYCVDNDDRGERVVSKKERKKKKAT